MSVEQNKANIAANRRRIFELENTVMFNRALAHATRSMVNENAALINKNYQAAFIGNRQLANQNTDDIFRNRTAIVRNIKASNQVEENYKDVLANKVKLEFLTHRAKLNEKVLKTSERLAKANKELIDINRNILDTNEEIVNFNAKMIENNKNLLANGVDASKATPESNADLIAANNSAIDALKKKAADNKERIQALMEQTQTNRASITSNAQSIADRRERILANHDKITGNQKKVADFISKL
jgi:uncharacterized coiled-coil DUF342 family protein